MHKLDTVPTGPGSGKCSRAQAPKVQGTIVTFKILPRISGAIDEGMRWNGTSKPEGKDKGPEYVIMVV
jgi:hypothetical protein